MDTEKRIENIEGDIKTIRENHLAHIQVDMALMKTDVSWLKNYHWITITASVGAVITGIINMIK